MFEEVSSRIDFPSQEKKVLAFWEERGIYQKSLDRRSGAPSFVFFEGPPTANGLPHPGHCLTRVIKDLFPRYFTMRGYRCERKAGWDTHGLPVEVEVGKELGIHSKHEIEEFGIEPFIKKCIHSVFRYTREWEELTRRLGFWVNLDEAYVTYHKSYVESVWWALKVLFEKGLLYQGHKVVWWWAQGGTALSSGEVGEGYRDTDDPSIYVRFRVKDPTALGLDADVPTSFLAWTTTPWTLSSNVALAVHAEHVYVVLDYKTDTAHERFILAQELVHKTFEGLKLDHEKELKVIGTLHGRDLVGIKYRPIFEYAEPTEGRAWEVDVADFVTLDSGTGIVHVAPAFGEDDYRFMREKGFGFLQLVQPDGAFSKEVVEFAGQFCKDADKDIIRLLKDRGVLLKREVYRHPYPFCPRAENDPLIQYARKSWFIATTKFKEEFLANNGKVNWLPEHIREGRFGDFLRNNVDWAISRERFWGTPLPIWQCETTGYQEAIGSMDELLRKPDVRGLEVWEEAKANDPTLPDDLMVHKPYIDSVTYQSPKVAAARMRRVSEVIDCWFDSGAMPFAQWGFPHQNREKFFEQYPADFISEALDQTRGWFYTLLAISTMLKDEFGPATTPAAKAPGEKNTSAARSFDYPVPFKTCIVLGLMLGEDGKKMSKRLKNYSEPAIIFDTLGADALRWFFTSAQAPWTTIRFQKSAIEEGQRDFLIRLQNVYSFFVIYANIDRFDPAKTPAPPLPERRPLDRWIMSELNQTLEFVTERMDQFDNFLAAGRLNEFVDALSNWYVRRSRDRFWGEGFSADKAAAYWTLYECLVTLAKAIAPFVPFFAEMIFQNLVRSVDKDAPESVHLCDWPAVDRAAIDRDLSFEGTLVREIVSVGRAARTASKLKVRQPLECVEVLVADHRLDPIVEKYAAIVADELNVKRVELAQRAADYVEFSAKPNLKHLGPRLGKRLPKLAQALAAADAGAIRQALIDDGQFPLSLDGERVELTSEDLVIQLTPRPGYAAAEGKRVVVVLTTNVTPELKREGLAREIVHGIQGLRKDAGLAFSDRIELGIVAAGACKEAVAAHGRYIAHETLAVRVDECALPQPLRDETLDIDGEPVRVTLKKSTA